MSTSGLSAVQDPTKNGEAAFQSWAGADKKGKLQSRVTGRSRGRSVPYLLLGLLIVVLCGTGGVVTAMQLGERESFLVLARPVAAGQSLSTTDLGQAQMASDSGLDLIPTSASSTVVGQPVAYGMPVGAVLTRGSLGPTRVPTQGMAIAAVGLKAGQFPPELSAGATVQVFSAPQTTSQAGTTSIQAASWTAVVTGISGRETEQTTVLSLQLSDVDARALATAPAGQMSVVIIAGGS
ncbi:hypothetical protein LWC34_30345 [Kibdelosporangium philippinense]|uniref:SAF domain-containing protein n=1 Tax=Kibdelosporangium philippinense TaxID=211113 RepID=A0ABS8ZHR4_9PSEU|nr:hypothetical protein [Kibdelosporangium philippinense]MCE7007097.1 hypothetical protein [Kibdelosporangium philippinense]